MKQLIRRYLYVWYRRTRRLDASLITDIRMLPESISTTLSDELQIDGWIKAEGNLHSGVWPSQAEMRLWYTKQDATSRRRASVNDSSVITEIDVLYGDGPAFFGFERVPGGKIMDEKAGQWESVDLTVRRGSQPSRRTQAPHFHPDGSLKIMQIADLHYSVGTGECRDTDKDGCIGDIDTEDWLANALDAEKPDMVVFSGDQLNGQRTSYDSRSVLAKFAKPVIDRQIPWAAIFGNHDSEDVGDRPFQMRNLQSMPYSLAQPGPDEVDGVGNYVIKLRSGDPSQMHLFTLYFLDSHAYQGTTLPWVEADYDYIKESQILWFLNESASIKPIERPFQPDGAADLGHIWMSKRSMKPGRLSRQDTTFAKPNAMMFFHIPLPEAYSTADVAGFDGEELDVGSQFDGQGSSKHNSGFFYNGIKQAFEAETVRDEWTGTSQVNEVKILSHGHCHVTDRCRRTDGIWSAPPCTPLTMLMSRACFDGGSSYSGYGQVDFDRRVRVYQISEYGEKVETYKRRTTGEIIDQQILVGPGAAAGVGMDAGSFA